MLCNTACLNVYIELKKIKNQKKNQKKIKKIKEQKKLEKNKKKNLKKQKKKATNIISKRKSRIFIKNYLIILL